MTLLDIHSAEDTEKLRLVAGSRDGSYLEGAVWRHNKLNGDQIQVAIYSRPLEHEGRPAALVAAVDVTQAREAAAEVASTRQFLDSVIENAPAPIIVENARSLQHLLVNRAAELFLGVARSSVIGKTVEQIYSPQTRPTF